MPTEIYYVTVSVVGLVAGVFSNPIYSNMVDMYSGTRPAAVTNLAATAPTYKGTTLSWTPPALPAAIDSYIVTRTSLVAGVPVSYSTKTASLTISDMLACTDYVINVQPVIVASNVYVKGPSAHVSVTTPNPKKAIDGVQIIAVSPTSAIVTIVDAGQNCIVSYKVTLLNVGGSEAERPRNTRDKSQTFDGLTSGSNYKAQIVVKYADGSSGEPVLSSQITMPPSSPALVIGQQRVEILANLANADGTELLYNPATDLPESARYSELVNSWCDLIQAAFENGAALIHVDKCDILRLQSGGLNVGSIEIKGTLTLSRQDGIAAPTMSAVHLQTFIKVGAAYTPSMLLASIGYALDTTVLQVTVP